jgi:hypothetical protein
MYQIKQSEATAARRRIPVLFVSSTDGFTPTTPTSPASYISVNGGTFVATTNAVTLETLASGQSASGCYYLELTAAEVGTLGVINVNVQSTNCRQYNAVIQVMAYDAYDIIRLGLTSIPNVAQGSVGAIPTGSATGQVTVATNNDKTGYSLATTPPTAAQIATQVWSETLPGTYTSGQAGFKLDAGTATNVWAATTRTLSAGTNIVLAKGTGITGFNDIAATDVWAATTRTLSAGTNIVLAKGTGLTGLNDITAQSVWDVATTAITAVGSIGVQLKTNIDVATSTRMATFSYTTPPTVAQISTQVWTEPIPGSFAAGSAGAKLNAASSAGDPWATALPGSYATGTAGNILGNRLDAAISSRMATFTYTTPPTAAVIATQVWSETLPGSYTSGQAGFKLNAAGTAADPWSTLLPGSYGAGTAGNIIGNRLDVAVSTRSTLTDALVWSYATRALTDKSNFSLASTQTFNMTGNITGSLSGSVGSVTGNVGGSVASVSGSIGGNVNGTVASVVGNVGGNVVGSVGSVSGTVGSVSNVSNIWDYLTANILTNNSIGLLLKTNVDAQISTRLASSSYTTAPTVAQIWQQALPGSFTTGQAGYIIGTNLNDTITSRMATFTYTTPPTTTQIMQALWNQSRATASPTGGIPAAGTFGFYIDKQLSTISGGSGGSGVMIKQGPFKLNATQDMGSNDILDLVQNDARNIVLEVIDEVGEPIPLSGSYTYTVNIYDIGGVGAGSYSGTVDYANGGQVSFDITTTTTATKGTYYVVLSIDNGTIITKYGGLRLEVR